MLAYLTVERSADRDALAGLFWADSPPDRARASLRRTLSSLRGGVGPDVVDADRNQVTLSGLFKSDLESFRALVAETGSHGHDQSDVCGNCVVPLQKASDIYRGDFLGAFGVRDAPDFEDWARTVTESYRLQASDVFQRLAMSYAGEGDYKAAIAAASRWTSLDELHEPAHRLVMLLHAWAGDRAGAIQAYRDCASILDSELGVSPLDETTELYEAILDEDIPPAPGPRRRVRMHGFTRSVSTSDMLDRQDAIAALDGLLTASGKGQVLITGDSWMGKTRLLEHATHRAREEGRHVVSGVAFRTERHLPYGVAVQLLTDLTEGLDSVDSIPGWVRQELHKLDPRLAPGTENPDTGQLGQLRLREAFLNLVEIVASQRPLLVIIDDAQWVDPASASLVAYLQRRVQDQTILFLLSARAIESLHPALREIALTKEKIGLDPLRRDDLESDLPDVDLDRIITATGGIPLLVQEAIDGGQLDADSSSVARYMDSRKQRVSDLGLQVLAAAAVLDGMCDASLLKDTSGRTEAEIVEAVEELIAAQLLREHEDGRLGFTLDVLESMTYQSTSLVRRRLLHGRAAQALAARPRASDARTVRAIAEHLRAAGSAEAPGQYRLAGDLAREVFANDEAITSYETAIALGHHDVGAIRLSLGELAMAGGDYETAKRELRTAAAQSSGPTLALVEHRIGDLNRIMGRFELAEEGFARAEPEHPDPSDLYAAWALLRHRTGDSDGARQYASLAEEAARKSQSRSDLARALNILGVVSVDTSVALAYINSALELTGPDDPARIAALNNKAHLLGSNGETDAAIVLVEEAIDISRRAGYRHHQAALLNHLADLNHVSGHEGRAAEALTEAVTLFADIVAGDWEPEVWLLRQW